MNFGLASKRQIKKPFILSILLTVCLAMAMVIGVGGCSDTSWAEFLQQRETVSEARMATTQAVADIEAELLELPENDPVREALESKLAKGKELLIKMEGYLKKADAVISAAENGRLDDPMLREAVRDIPYGPLALSVITIAWGLWERFGKARANSALKEVVKSVEAATPPRTEEQKKLINSIQSPETRALVSKVKGD